MPIPFISNIMRIPAIQRQSALFTHINDLHHSCRIHLNHAIFPSFRSRSDAGATVCSLLLIMQTVAVFISLMGIALTASDHARQSFYATASAAIFNIILKSVMRLPAW